MSEMLSLEQAATVLGITKRKCSAYVEALGVPRHKGDDRRVYLATQDIQTIQSFHQMDVKSNPAYYGMIMYSSDPQPVSMPRNYKSYSKECFGGNDTVMKVVSYLTQNASAIPPVLYTDRTLKKSIDTHPLLDKLDMPNEEDSGVDYREACLGYLLIDGNSYQYAIRKGVNGPPDELWTLQPNKVEPLAAQVRGIAGFRYLDYPDSKNPILPQNIGRMKFWNPDNPLFGMSPLQVGAMLVDMQTSARKWNLAMMQNGAKLSGAWTTDTILSPNDRIKLEQRLNEKFAGPRGAGKAPLLDGGFKWNQIGASPNDLDWLEALKYNAGAIANLYNLAPQLIGDTSASTYNNMEEAKAASYTEAIFPLLDRLYSLWNRWLVPMWPDLKGAYLYYDKTTVEVVQNVIQARETAKAQRANQSYQMSVATLDEARAMAGLPALPGGQGKVFKIGAVLVPATEIMKYAEQSLTKPAAPPIPAPEPIQLTPGDPSNPPDEKPAEENDDANNPSGNRSKPARNNPSQSTDPEKRAPIRNTKALDLESRESKAAYRDQMEAARERWTSNAQRRIADYFDSERKAMTAAIKQHSGEYDYHATISDALTSLTSRFVKTLRGLYEDIVEDVGTEIYASFPQPEKAFSRYAMKATPAPNLLSASTVARLLQFAGLRVKQINLVTLAKIQDELAEGVSLGESIPQLAKRIDQLYLADIIPNRSTVIARTEVISASNQAALSAGYAFQDSTGQSLNKVWLATDDNRTRPAHVEADGQEVAIDEKFVVGGEELDCPGDSAGSAGNVIQCRCTTYFKRIKANQDTSSDTSGNDGTEAEKRRRRYEAKKEYREFMEGVLV